MLLTSGEYSRLFFLYFHATLRAQALALFKAAATEHQATSVLADRQ